MAFDQATRNRLARFVGDARALLSEEFTRQLQREYGMDPASGEVTPMDRLTQLDDSRYETARLLRETMEHYLAHASGQSAKVRQDVLTRIVREQAFTVLNRLCALRMAEARELLLEAVGHGYTSKGFQLYARLAGSALGETGDAYRCYLFSVFDELAVDLPVLFDRFSPQGRLFPHETTLLKLLDMANDADIAPLWVEDETIGWIYQYFNSKEERKDMREASQAPRNSRELAVRNQFFTPRYVVEFLTDNTLGRIWYEMTQGQTSLVDNCRYLVRRPAEIFLASGEQAPAEEASQEELSQEELLRLPVYIPFRPLKDPRNITMLDPACGSMHFGLYAFDLFERIYEEAWDIEEQRGPGALERAPMDGPLHEDFSDRDAFLREVPRLIVERNIHGVDIDPRAVQIAGLSLWLRAQKSWRDRAIKPQQRPQIRRSKVVCAEPMPGETALLREFLDTRLSATPEDRLVGSIVARVFEAMKLAGEAGSLLKIEDEISGIVKEAMRQWQNGPRLSQANFLSEPARARQEMMDLDTSEITDASFWGQAEGRIYDALRAYADEAENGDSFRRRLFANDAARGFAFIDICRARYDVVLMNPPFGDRILSCQIIFETMYGDGNFDLYHYFYNRSYNITNSLGVIGAITPRTMLYQSSYISLRKEWLEHSPSIHTINELDLGVLDTATVRPAFITLSKIKYHNRIFYQNLKYSKSPDIDMLHGISEFNHGNLDNMCTFHSIEDFSNIPGLRLSLWTTGNIIKVFSHYDTIEPTIGKVTEGLTNESDSRFLRCWWETPFDSENIWKPFGKFDSRSTFVPDFSIVINWSRSAYIALGELGNRRANESLYFLPGIAFTRSCEVGMAATTLPKDFVFSSVSRYLIFTNLSTLGILGFLNTKLVEALHLILTPDRDRISGTLRRIPIIIKPEMISSLENYSKLIWDIKCSWLQSRFETFRYFHGADIKNPINILTEFNNICQNISSIEQSIEHIVSSNSQFHDNDLEVLYREANQRLGERDLIIHNTNFLSMRGILNGIISYLVGTIYGRWDIRYATGAKPVPELPDPFAPLPTCPPGMLQNAQGLPAAPEDVPADYPLRISWDGILVDDEGHREEIIGRVRDALHVIWGERAEAIEQEACEILAIKSLRDYFQKPAGFFEDHLKRYSKSRRQAPIYWPLSTAKGSYTLWLYYHRLSDQILYSCVNDFVDPKLASVAEQIAQIRRNPARSRQQENELEHLVGLEQELQEFRTELLRIAAFWKPNLNDGVQITAAPLWKLFQLRAWQKKLKETWQSLEEGEYDWAHLAYSIWPERVREKCKSDKSLAIAHDLEHLYVEPPAGSTKKRGRAKKIEAEEQIEEE